MDIDNEPADERALALRSPSVPTTLSELAALKGEAIEVIEARAQVLHTLRVAAIRESQPTDWVLFKSPAEHGGQTVGYLADCGCDRIRDLFGIEVFGLSVPLKIAGAGPGEFLYVITGSGRSRFTRQVVENIEGGRASTDDFAKDVEGPALELLIRKAARANLDSNITRELAGLKSVPVEELQRAWDGTPKKVEHCRLGRGFGSRSERLGGTSERAPDVPAPMCPFCKIAGVYRPAKGNRAAFYGCSKYTSHPKGSKPFIVDAAEWLAKQPAAAAPAAEGTNGTTNGAPFPDGPCIECGKLRAEHATADHEYEVRS